MAEDDLDQSLKLDVLAASLRADGSEVSELLETLTKILQAAVPEHTSIVRGGWLLSKERPISELSVKFEDYEYQITRGKHGSFSGRSRKYVKGVVLKTNDVTLDECIKNILTQLETLAANNAQARQALNKFVLG